LNTLSVSMRILIKLPNMPRNPVDQVMKDICTEQYQARKIFHCGVMFIRPVSGYYRTARANT
jgi:hypothetical protein